MHSYTVYREIYQTMWHDVHEATCLPKPPKRLDCHVVKVPANFPLDFRL